MDKPVEIKTINDLKYYQFVLDERINKENGNTRADTIDNRARALSVEINELFNETKFFKDWSKKQVEYSSAPYPKSVKMEYIDCIHFMLSLAIDYDIDVEAPIAESGNSTWEELFDIGRKVIDDHIRIFITCSPGYTPLRATTLKIIYNHINFIGAKLELDEQEIIDLYLEKNKINHDRQNNGY